MLCIVCVVSPAGYSMTMVVIYMFRNLKGSFTPHCCGQWCMVTVCPGPRCKKRHLDASLGSCIAFDIPHLHASAVSCAHCNNHPLPSHGWRRWFNVHGLMCPPPRRRQGSPWLPREGDLLWREMTNLPRAGASFWRQIYYKHNFSSECLDYWTIGWSVLDNSYRHHLTIWRPNWPRGHCVPDESVSRLDELHTAGETKSQIERGSPKLGEKKMDSSEWCYLEGKNWHIRVKRKIRKKGCFWRLAPTVDMPARKQSMVSWWLEATLKAFSLQADLPNMAQRDWAFD